MTQQTEFVDRFSRIQANLEKAIGDKQTAWLATLSIIAGTPLLIDSQSSQVKLARAVASVIQGTCESLGFGFEALTCNVLYMGNLDTCHCLPAGCLRLASTAGLSTPSKDDKVVVLIGQVSPPHSRKSMPSASMVDQFATFARVNIDGERVTNAEPAVTLAEVADMRKYVRDNVEPKDAVLELIRGINVAATPGDSDMIPDELAQYVASGPTPRTWIHLVELARVVAASQGRTDVQRSDVLALVETVMTHRYVNDSVSPYNRFDLGRAIAKAVLEKLPAE
jgi:hypothetical protein